MEKRESSRWLSDAEAMRFAFALSEFRIDNETGIRKPDEPFKTVSARIEPILDLIEEFAPVHFATLWKCKTRGGVISAIARSMGYDPKPRELSYEYVCSLNDRRRWKMVSITIIQQFADILRSINDEEDRSSIEDELRQLEPLRYLLESVAEEMSLIRSNRYSNAWRLRRGQRSRCPKRCSIF